MKKRNASEYRITSRLEALDTDLSWEVDCIEDALSEYLVATDWRQYETMDPLFKESMLVAIARHILDIRSALENELKECSDNSKGIVR